MILQALTQYYERKSESESGALPPFGFGMQSIPVVIEIDQDGEESQVLIREPKSAEAQEMVPAAVKRAAGNAPNLLWDNVEYCLGIDTRGNPQRTDKRHQMFLDRLEELDCDDEGVEALKRYLVAAKQSAAVEQHNDLLMTNPNVSFRLLGDPHLICQRKKVVDAIRNSLTPTTENDGFCLVSGTKEPTARLHPAIKGVWGAQSSGANIVSFNLDAFNSHGKSQGYNCPVGEKAAFFYTTALNHLLHKESGQRMQVGDASTVFWSERKTSLEKSMGGIFGSTPSQIKDDPDKYTDSVKAVYDSVHRGRYHGDDADTKFYVLGLSPNASRIAIRFWHVATVGEISTRIKRHFDDLRIVRAPHEQEYLSLSLLLIGVAAKAKSAREKKRFSLAEKQPDVAESLMKDLLKKGRLPPSLAGELLKSALGGTPYPHALLAAAIRRNKAEQEVTYPRAAIIKASLNRFHQREEIQMALDKSNPNPGYRLGRLFAALEKIQEDAAKPNKLNATIRDRYYGAASSSPVSVFSTLLKLKNHHLAKMELGQKVRFEKLIGEIMSELPDFAANLNLKDQGRFAVGYYHQRQDFFTSHKTPEPGDES